MQQYMDNCDCGGTFFIAAMIRRNCALPHVLGGSTQLLTKACAFEIKWIVSGFYLPELNENRSVMGATEFRTPCGFGQF
jgi:hypothetical protein